MFPFSAAEAQSAAVRQNCAACPSGLASLAVLVPAWEPDQRLVGLVRALVGAGFGWVVVVDDGSGAGSAAMFAAVGSVDRVAVLRHAVNRGKGRALKTGFEYLAGFGQALSGVVTADADGQHTVEDIVRVGEGLLGGGGRAVLGVRGFAGAVPWRSRFGNTVARRMFALLAGRKVTDTQTGLRGLPLPALPELLKLRGERYEYEITMLAYLCRGNVQPVEVPIATVYLEGNRGSHFHPVWDSLRVYGALVQDAVSSLASRWR